MFKLLSKESNIFSIPVYIGILLLIVLGFNLLNFSYISAVSGILTFVGISLGYFCFHAIGLNYQTHLPLFLYTFFVIGFYPGYLDIGLAVSLVINAVLLLILTDKDDDLRHKSYVLIGALLAINYIFLPTMWPLIFFVLLHIIGTSNRVGLQIFRLFFGAFLVSIVYFSIAFFYHCNAWDGAYFPFYGFHWVKDLSNLYPLIPIALFFVYAVFDHFSNFNKKSPVSKFKYSFVLTFTLSQLITIFLYMGNHYEYLLLLAVPVTIILSRALRFLPKYVYKEVGLLVIIICLVLYRIFNYVTFL